MDELELIVPTPGIEPARSQDFFCQRWPELRLLPYRECHVSADSCQPPNCFLSPTAHCFQLDSLGAGDAGWACSPTSAECGRQMELLTVFHPKGPCVELRTVQASVAWRINP